MSMVIDPYRFAAAGGFNPQTDITWHSLFWVEGSAFEALGLADTNAVATWPNETTETDAAAAVTRPTYDASSASYNSKPVVNWASATDKALATGAFSVNPTYPISVVAIANLSVNDSLIFDGIGSGGRGHVYRTGGNAYQLFQGGTPRTTGGGADDGAPHLFVAYFNSGGNDRLDRDGTTLISGTDAGSDTYTGLSIGNYGGDGNTYSIRGNVALIGIYEGDITANGAWADFCIWAEGHYGLTIA